MKQKKKRDKKYNPEKYKQSVGLEMIKSMFNSKYDHPLSENNFLFDRYRKDYYNILNNLEKNNFNLENSMCMMGTFKTIEAVHNNSNYLMTEIERYTLRLFIQDKVFAMYNRFNKDNKLSFINNEEKQALEQMYEMALSIFERMTNRQYDQIITCSQKQNKDFQITTIYA